MSDAPRDDLTERVAELEDALDELRGLLDRPLRDPFRLRPPSPGEVLRLADAGVTATIAILEANVRALELLQRSIRAADSGRAADGRRGGTRERAGDLSRETLDRLDRVLAEIGDALEDAPLPRDREAREIVENARRLNDEIRERVEDAERGTVIDVEEELESIRDEVERDDGEKG